MGLDVFAGATNQAVLDAGEYDYDQHRLSRAFCDLLDRQWAGTTTPEIDQIGHLTGVDISPLYAMAAYQQPEDLAAHLAYALDEEEATEIAQQAAEAADAVAGNIDRVLATLPDLPARLTPTDTNPRYDLSYFANFDQARWNRFDNTFGEDLRHLHNFLRYAKAHGSTTVFFAYG
jgi:hypothetical protein